MVKNEILLVHLQCNPTLKMALLFFIQLPFLHLNFLIFKTAI